MKLHMINNPLHYVKTVKAKSKLQKNAQKLTDEQKQSSNEFLGVISYRKFDKAIHIATTRAGYTDFEKWYVLKPDGTLVTSSSNQKKPQEYAGYTIWSLYGKTKDKMDATKGKMDKASIEEVVKNIEAVINSK